MGGYSANLLEKTAKEYADKAVIAEKMGNYEDAIKYYRAAAQILRRIISINPDSGLRDVYVEFIRSYEERAQFLEKNIQRIATTSRGEEREGIEIRGQDLVSEPPRITFEDIVDLEEVKKAMKKAIIYPVKRPDLYVDKIGWDRGILLFGPPGNGKTMLAAAVANEIKAAFISIDASDIMSKWLGDAEKNVRRVFETARKISREGRPVIIVIDEVDSLMGVFSTEVGGEVRVRNQFLKEMDGLYTKGSREMIFVIGTTNKPWVLDIGFIRRFQKRIYIPSPNYEVRLALLKHYTKNLELDPDVDLEEIARKTEGYSASDVVDIVREAYSKVVEELFEKGSIGERPRLIKMNDLLEALSKRKPSISHEMIKSYEEWYKRFGAM
ncbi:MAG: AAA family ATPase [Desulfurococcales archaeon]|nr:AAA family ATPase [Desulfurococcales archaeon]